MVSFVGVALAQFGHFGGGFGGSYGGHHGHDEQADYYVSTTLLHREYGLQTYRKIGVKMLLKFLRKSKYLFFLSYKSQPYNFNTNVYEVQPTDRSFETQVTMSLEMWQERIDK